MMSKKGITKMVKRLNKKIKEPIITLPINKEGTPGPVTPEQEHESMLIRLVNGDIVKVVIVDRTTDNEFALVQYGPQLTEWKEVSTLEVVHKFPKKEICPKPSK